MPRPLVLTDADVMTPPGQQFWTTPDMWDPRKRQPVWLTGDVGKTFLAQSRWTVTNGLARAHGVEGLPDLDPPRDSSSSERFTFRLYDVELLAHHLAVQTPSSMTPGKLRKVIVIVRTIAQLHGYL